MKTKKIRIAGVVLVGILWLGLAAAAWLHTPQDMSLTERRKLAQFPQLSSQTVLDGRFMSKFETYTLDQFPMRDAFRRLKAVFSYKVLGNRDNNGIYLTQGHGAKLEYPLNTSSAETAVEKFQKIYEQYLQDSENIVFSVVPDKSFYLAEPNGYPAMDYDRLFAMMQEGLPFARYVDITDTLSADDYYRTDTHWRQERILPAAGKLAQALGVPGPKAEDFRIIPVERLFYGVYYGQAALPMAGETMYVMQSDVLENCTVKNYETNQSATVYDLEKQWGKDPYDVFLSGPVSIETIENPQGPDRELLIFRDSFGSSLAPLLVQDYSKVTLIDIRYVPTAYLSKFLDFHGQDVLMLYSPMVLNNSAMLK